MKSVRDGTGIAPSTFAATDLPFASRCTLPTNVACRPECAEDDLVPLPTSWTVRPYTWAAV